MKIICVGGGPAGIYAALLSKQADREAVVGLQVRLRKPGGRLARRLCARPTATTRARSWSRCHRQLAGQPLPVQPNTDGTLPWRSFLTIRNRSWTVGNLALMGDAAHTTHYSIGFGTKLALEDAICPRPGRGR